MRGGHGWSVAGSSPGGGADPRHRRRGAYCAAGLQPQRGVCRNVETAKAHNVSTLSLADALVALAQNQASLDGDDAAFVAARAAWGHLFDTTRPSRGTRGGREDNGVAGA